MKIELGRGNRSGEGRPGPLRTRIVTITGLNGTLRREMVPWLLWKMRAVREGLQCTAQGADWACLEAVDDCTGGSTADIQAIIETHNAKGRLDVDFLEVWVYAANEEIHLDNRYWTRDKVDLLQKEIKDHLLPGPDRTDRWDKAMRRAWWRRQHARLHCKTCDGARTRPCRACDKLKGPTCGPDGTCGNPVPCWCVGQKKLPSYV